MKKNLGKTCGPVKAEPLLLRLNYCATMLSINGLISQSERDKVHNKIMKLKAKLEKQR